MSHLENYSIQDFGKLDLLARQVVEGFIIGLHKSPFHGFSVEFAEHRLYNTGEATRNIDWKVFARTDRLYTKKYEEETNLRCQIVIDSSSSMYFPDPAVDIEGRSNKISFSALAAASLMNLLRKQRDAYGLSIFDEELRLHTQCKSSTTHYRLLLSYLEKHLNDAVNNKRTSAAETLHKIADSIHRRSMVIIFSDMFDASTDNESLFSALQHLKHNKHEVVLFHVLDRSKEEEFEYSNRPYLFIDMESGEQVKLQSNQVKEFYKKQIKEFNRQLKLKCLQFKIDFVEADIRKGFQPILEAFLVKRSKMNA